MCLLFCQFCYYRLANIAHLTKKKAIVCVDLIANIFGKNPKTSVFEGGRVIMIVHCSTEGLSTSDVCWMGLELLTFFADVINERLLIR